MGADILSTTIKQHYLSNMYNLHVLFNDRVKDVPYNRTKAGSNSKLHFSQINRFQSNID